MLLPPARPSGALILGAALRNSATRPYATHELALCWLNTELGYAYQAPICLATGLFKAPRAWALVAPMSICPLGERPPRGRGLGHRGGAVVAKLNQIPWRCSAAATRLPPARRPNTRTRPVVLGPLLNPARSGSKSIKARPLFVATLFGGC